MQSSFPNIFDDVRHESSSIILLSLTDEGILIQTGFLEHEIKLTKDLALEKANRQKTLKGYVALQILEKISFFVVEEITNHPLDKLPVKKTAHPNLTIDPELIKRKTKNVANAELKNKTETHDHQNFLKSLKLENEY